MMILREYESGFVPLPLRQRSVRVLIRVLRLCAGGSGARSVIDVARESHPVPSPVKSSKVQGSPRTAAIDGHVLEIRFHIMSTRVEIENRSFFTPRSFGRWRRLSVHCFVARC